MWLIRLILTIVNLILVSKNKFKEGKIIALVMAMYYVISSWHAILNIILMIQSGIISIFELIPFIAETAVLILLCVFVFKERRKPALCLLWIMLFNFIAGTWNIWLNFIFYVKSLLLK